MYVLWNQSSFFLHFLFFGVIHIKLTKVICLTRLHYKTSLGILPHGLRASSKAHQAWRGLKGMKLG